MQHHGKKSLKWLILFAMIFVVINVAADILAYKMVQIGPFLMSSGVFIVPFSYACSDIVTEVYGYKLSRQIIWFGLLAELLFDLICYVASNFQSPSFIDNNLAFKQILHPLIYVYFSVLIASIISYFLNIYCISKWKILLKGKYFWLRSIGATGIAELIFTIICDGLVFSIALTSPMVIQTIISTFAIKIIFAIILSFPISIIAYALKQVEGVDPYDNHINFNPFNLTS
jgi:uncharacterized integral membrane protein (TIGR00697 family)